MKKYNLSITKDYVSSWGAVHAVREVIQNSLDSDAPFCYEISGDTLSLYSANVVLQPKSLLLGCTTKDSTNIGSFGEGYKLALLVLTRLGYNVEIYNGQHMWIPMFEHDNRFDAEILVIAETPMTVSNEGLTFIIHDLSQADLDDVKKSCIMMQDSVGKIRSTRYGDILLEKPGTLYVGGLFICNTELTYGYNIKPEYLKLERDRQTVDNWDLKTMTRDMWYDTKDYDQIAEFIEAKVPDLDYVKFSSPEMVKEACYKLFRSKCPTGGIVGSREELEKMIKKGLVVHHYHDSFYTAVSRSVSYTDDVPKTETTTPHQDLMAWYEASKFNMHDKVKRTFKTLIEESKSWKK